MRLRNVPGAREVMIENEYVFTEPEGMKGTWSQVFGNDNPIRIEIGMGKGTFITTLAANNPDINYVGIEKYSSVLLRAVEKQDELQLPNLRFIRMDAEAICEVFGAGEVDRIYLNFSDPWPKERHAKRRLTSPIFLEKYDKIFKSNAEIIMKTDNNPLFEYSKESLENFGYQIKSITRDLYQEDVSQNIKTEYEKKFVKLGVKINRLAAVKQSKSNNLPKKHYD